MMQGVIAGSRHSRHCYRINTSVLTNLVRSILICHKPEASWDRSTLRQIGCSRAKESRGVRFHLPQLSLGPSRLALVPIALLFLALLLFRRQKA
jgi:hypothetical protein